MTHNPHPHTSNEYRILNVIREHYSETAGVLISHDIRHLANEEVYLAYIVVSYETDASYVIRTETVRVDITAHSREINFTLLTEFHIDLTSAVK